MKKLLALMLMTMLAATYSWGYVTINVTYNGTDAFKTALEEIEGDETSTTTDPDNNTVTYKRAYTTASDHNRDDRSDKLKLVITPAAGAPDFDATAVSVLNAYLEDRWPQYREIDLSACTTLTALPAGAFSGRDLVRIWSMPSTITTIGNNAFDGCKEATSITFGTGSSAITSVGNWAFNNCNKLTSINLDNCTSIGNNAFGSCSSFTSLSLPAITTVPSDAFNGMKINGNLSLPGVTTVNGWAFSRCTANSLTVGTEGTTLTLSEGAFRDSSIPTITLHDTSVIPAYCFADSEVTKLVMDAVTSIGVHAFSGNMNIDEKMTAVPFTVAGCNGWASTCTKIPEGCFSGCMFLSTIDIPASITTIDRSFVDMCLALTEINVHDNNTEYSSVDHMLCNKAGIIHKTKCSRKIKRGVPFYKTKCSFSRFPPPQKKCLIEVWGISVFTH